MSAATDLASGSTPLRYTLARWRAFLWRFQTLPYAERLFSGCGGPTVLRRRFRGFNFHVDVSRTNTHRLLFLEGERFVAEAALIAGLVQPGMRVVDVGANIGYYMLLFESLVGPGGSIACFEPEPDNLVELRRNVAANRLANVEVHAVAIGERDGTASLRPGMNGIVAPLAEGNVTVPIRRLDSLVSGSVDLVKMDVEGYELQVLRGASQTLAQSRPVLFIEVHPTLLAPPATVAEVFALLRPLYPSLEAFGPAALPGPVAVIGQRYLGLGAIRRFPDLRRLLDACESGEQRDPFWLVGRSFALGSRAAA